MAMTVPGAASVVRRIAAEEAAIVLGEASGRRATTTAGSPGLSLNPSNHTQENSMATATRKAPVEPETPAPSYDMGLKAEDVTLDRLRVVGKLAKLVELEVAKPGDIAVGQDAEDEGSALLWKAKDGGTGVIIHVLKVHANYGCKFGGPQGSWEEGDPEMPPEAQRQYNYLLCIPAHDTQLPVLYTASSTAARAARGINKALAIHTMAGLPYELAFEMTTKVNTAGTNSWPGPVFKRVEATAENLAVAKTMFEDVVGEPAQQLGAGEPTF